MRQLFTEEGLPDLELISKLELSVILLTFVKFLRDSSPHPLPEFEDLQLGVISRRLSNHGTNFHDLIDNETLAGSLGGFSSAWATVRIPHSLVKKLPEAEAIQEIAKECGKHPAMPYIIGGRLFGSRSGSSFLASGNEAVNLLHASVKESYDFLCRVYPVKFQTEVVLDDDPDTADSFSPKKIVYIEKKNLITGEVSRKAIATIRSMLKNGEADHKRWFVDNVSSSSFDSEKITDGYRPVPQYEDDPEKLKTSAYQLYKAIRQNPLPPEAISYVRDRGLALAEEKKALVSRLHDIRREEHQLTQFTPVSRADREQPVEDLVKFIDENSDDLYNNMGKEFARSFRALAREVIDLVDPDAALWV